MNNYPKRCVTDIQTASKNISLAPAISGPRRRICYTAAFNCGPCDNFCYLGHNKNSDDNDE